MRDHLLGWPQGLVALNGVPTHTSRRTPSRPPMSPNREKNRAQIDKLETAELDFGRAKSKKEEFEYYVDKDTSDLLRIPKGLVLTPGKIYVVLENSRDRIGQPYLAYRMRGNGGWCSGGTCADNGQYTGTPAHVLRISTVDNLNPHVVVLEIVREVTEDELK